MLCSVGLPLYLELCRELAFADLEQDCTAGMSREFELLFDDPTGQKWLDWLWSCTGVIDALAVAVKVPWGT